MDNGYYLITNLDAGSGHNYSYNTSAIFDFYPKEGSDYTYALKYYPYDSSYAGLSFETPFSTTDRFYINILVANNGYVAYDGVLRAKVIDKNGNPKTDLSIYINESNGWTDRLSVGKNQITLKQIGLSLSESISIALGDRIVIYCTTDVGKTVYEPIQYCLDGSVLNELPLVPAAFIKKKNTSYKQNDWFVFELINNDYLYAGTVWTITDPDGTQVVKQQSDKEFQFTKTGQYKIEAATASTAGSAVIEKIVTYITVN